MKPIREQPTLSIKRRLEKINTRIREAAQRHGRDEKQIKLLAVSKTRPASVIAEAVRAGQSFFGENYVQEVLHKMKDIHDEQIEWHFIGPVQSNKTRHIAAAFSWAQSIDRPSILQRLSRQRPASLPDINVCVQVNIDGESTKAGVPPADVGQLIDAAAELPRIRLRGLMIIPSPTSDTDLQRRSFAKARKIFDHYSDAYRLDTLSMGMSQDFEAAIAEGTTLIRLGVAIFGPREPATPTGSGSRRD